MGEVHRPLSAAAFICLCCSSVRRFTSLGVHFERSSFAFLGSFLLDITGTKHGKEGRGAERTVGVSAGRCAGVTGRGEFGGLNVERWWA